MATAVLEKPKAAAKNARAGVIEVQAAHLARALRQIEKLVERKQTLPILSMVLIEAGPTGLSLCGTDLDIWVRDRVDASCHPNEIVRFSTCVSARKLYEAVHLMPGEASVRLTKGNDGRLHVHAHSLFGPVDYRFPTLPIDDFPAEPQRPDQCAFAMPAFTLAAAIDAVRHAISTEETRYYLNGIFLHADKGKLVLAATDGHRLARWRGELPDGAKGMPDAIIARKSVALITSIIDALDGKAVDATDIEIALSSTRIHIGIGTVDLTAKLIDGTYPEYRRVIPTGNDKVAVVNPGWLQGAVRQVMLMGSEKTRAVKCEFQGSGLLAVHFDGRENGIASAELQCDYAGEPLTIGFNAEYLLAILNRMGGEACTLRMADAAAPTTIVNYEGAASDYTLMPMRV